MLSPLLILSRNPRVRGSLIRNVERLLSNRRNGTTLLKLVSNEGMLGRTPRHYGPHDQISALWFDPKKIPPPPSNPFVRSEADKEKQNKQSEEDKGDDEETPPKWVKMLVMAMGGSLAFLTLYSFLNDDRDSDMIKNISWNEFVSDMLSRGEVKKMTVYPDSENVVIELFPGAIVKGERTNNLLYRLKITDLAGFEERLRSTEKELGIPEPDRVPLTVYRVATIFNYVIPLMFFGVLLGVMAKLGNSVVNSFSGSMSQFTKAKFTIIDPTKPKTGKLTSFKDVAGMEEAKKEVLEFVDYLKHPERFKALGAKAPRGALLLGPPGCGKTLLAKAVAAEANVPFLTMAGSEFVEMIGGLGAARVRDLFKEARKRNPCIVYIDEIDAMGRRRAENNANFGGSGEEEQTLNQLLVEMDGMSTTEGVIMLASTNRADILDRALLRPGRFDRQIDIDPPTAIERKAIFEVYLNKLHLEKSATVYSLRLATLTPGMSGADIANVVNEAALHAAREGQKSVGGANFEHAVERTVFGTEKRSNALQRDERRVLAYHESGHALCGWLLEHTDALLKVSIAPRTNSRLGFSQTSPSDVRLYSKEQLFDRMCMTLGGRVAELLVFNRVTTAGEDDLKKVTRMAYRQIRLYGMNEAVGTLSYDVDVREGGGFSAKPYSKSLGSLIDSEARKMVQRAFEVTEELLKNHLDALEKLSSKLIEKEVLNCSDIESLIGPSPFPEKKKIELSEWEAFTETEGAAESRPTSRRERKRSPKRGEDE